MDEVTRRTVRQDRRFLWLWLTAATICSVAGNVGHALVEAIQRAKPDAIAAAPPSLTADLLFWSSVGWAVVPPLLLMLAVHGLPTLARMLGTDESDPMLKVVVWGVVVAAFGWSAYGIFTFTVAVGVPAAVAWVAPLAIDLSVFGATRGLVKTAPLAARLKVHESTTLAHEPESTEPMTPAVTVRDPKPTESVTRAHEPKPTASTTRAREPKSTVRDPKPVNRVRESDPMDYEPAARRLVESGKTTLDSSTIVRLLTLRDEIGMTAAAKELDVSLSTAKRTASNVRELAVSVAPEAETEAEAEPLVLAAAV